MAPVRRFSARHLARRKSKQDDPAVPRLQLVPPTPQSCAFAENHPPPRLTPSGLKWTSFHPRASSPPPAPTVASAATVTRRRQRVRKPRPDHIPRPPNAFLLYRSHLITQIQIPEKTNISQIAGSMWAEISSEEKAYWYAQADLVKEQHRVLYPDYKYTPCHQQKPKDGVKKSTKRYSPIASQTPAERTRPAVSKAIRGVEGAKRFIEELRQFDKQPTFRANLLPSVPPIAHRRPSSCPPPLMEGVSPLTLEFAPHDDTFLASTDATASGRHRLPSLSPSRITRPSFSRASGMQLARRPSSVDGSQFTDPFAPTEPLWHTGPKPTSTTATNSDIPALDPSFINGPRPILSAQPYQSPILPSVPSVPAIPIIPIIPTIPDMSAFSFPPRSSHSAPRAQADLLGGDPFQTNPNFSPHSTLPVLPPVETTTLNWAAYQENPSPFSASTSGPSTPSHNVASPLAAVGPPISPFSNEDNLSGLSFDNLLDFNWNYLSVDMIARHGGGMGSEFLDYDHGALGTASSLSGWQLHEAASPIFRQ